MIVSNSADVHFQTIECTREELEGMKANYKTRMIDARYQKLVEEERKQVVEAARTGIARPFGEQGKSNLVHAVRF